MNSGEGGLLTTNDAEIAARAVISSGSYMLYGRHGAIPAEEVFQEGAPSFAKLFRQNGPNAGRDAPGTVAYP